MFNLQLETINYTWTHFETQVKLKIILGIVAVVLYIEKE